MALLRLYSRHGCHLCDVMQQELMSLLHGYPHELIVEDVDSREDWRQRYGVLVPVLTDDSGRELCHFHLDEAAVQNWLRAGVVNPDETERV